MDSQVRAPTALSSCCWGMKKCKYFSEDVSVGEDRQEAAGEAGICKKLIGIDIAEPFAGRRNWRKLKAQYSYAVRRKSDLCGIITNGFGCAKWFWLGVYNKGQLNSLTRS